MIFLLVILENLSFVYQISEIHKAVEFLFDVPKDEILVIRNHKYYKLS